MSNKYQEALNKLRFAVSISQDLPYKECNELCDIIYELVDKETPIKVVKWKLAQPETRCAKCGAGLERKHDYCPNCGQRLDWSDNDEC